MKKVFLTTHPSQTKRVGEFFAKEILNKRLGKKAVVIGLMGDLGGGKTTFLQGFARGLGIKEKILSPTFVIMKSFQLSAFSYQRFYHIDCYRIQKPKELLNLGFKKITADSRNIIAIEWADRIKTLLPRRTLTLVFEFVDKNKRKILFTA